MPTLHSVWLVSSALMMGSGLRSLLIAPILVPLSCHLVNVVGMVADQTVGVAGLPRAPVPVNRVDPYACNR